MSDERWGFTEVNFQKFTYSRIISNFCSILREKREAIESPTFSSGARDKNRWSLKIHLNGLDEESEGYLSVYLTLLSCPRRPVWAKFQFWIIDSDREETQGMKSPRFSRFLENQQ